MDAETPDAPEPSGSYPEPITVEEVARYPLPGTAVPGEISFSPDGGHVTYLWSPAGGLTHHLYSHNLNTGEQSLLVAAEDENGEEDASLQEALRRERQRQRTLGVTQYAWAKLSDRLLFSLGGDVYVKDGLGGSLRRITGQDSAPVLDPQLSPDGNWVAYVQDAELCVVPAAGGEACQLTRDARGTGKTNGLAEFIAQEEMHREHGFWWSPDGEWIAFCQVDETHIPTFRIVHQGKDIPGDDAQEDHRYPFAGAANAHVRLGVVPVQGGEPMWMDLDADGLERYVARVQWLPDGGLSAQLESRAQKELELVRFDPRTGCRTTLLHETSDVWINLHDLFRPLKHVGDSGGGFVWASERTGFRHLYLYDGQGNLLRPLTQGEWMVDDTVAVDEEHGYVYFTATRDGPTECHLYRVALSGGEPRRITSEAGTHTVVLDHGNQRFIDVHNALDRPPTVTLRSLPEGAPLCTIYDKPDPRVERLPLQAPELVSLQNRTDITLFGSIYRPPADFGKGPFPTIISVYGGPHVQMVTNSWRTTVAMRAQYLRQKGFLVFALDNQGSARRGLEFEGAITHRLGQLEVQDQVDGVRWLVDQGLADPDRVGVYGWSYGGYLAAMCLAQEPGVFRVAVAGAPVTHYDGYDTHYTERYMSTPQSNPAGYDKGSVMRYVKNITGKLLLIHGLIDENVHFRHTARLIQALISARKPYDLLLLPNMRHGPRKPSDRVYIEERICDYFTQNLGKRP